MTAGNGFENSPMHPALSESERSQNDCPSEETGPRSWTERSLLGAGGQHDHSQRRRHRDVGTSEGYADVVVAGRERLRS